MKALFVLLISLAAISPSAAKDAAVSIDVAMRCEAMNPAYCKGAFGFHIAEDGTFRVGPGPSGETATGRLNADETHALSTSLARIDRLAANSISACGRRPGIPGVLETVKVAAGGKIIEMRGVGGVLDRTCAGGLSAAHAALFRAAHALMIAHYSVPFPGDGGRQK
jgi:hypothetical protein